MNFAERLKITRLERKYSQKTLADTLGMAEIAYRRYEYGMREPAFKHLIRLADALDVSLDYLVGRTDNPEVNR